VIGNGNGIGGIGNGGNECPNKTKKRKKDAKTWVPCVVEGVLVIKMDCSCDDMK
jgi:hypothetical protein